MFGKVKRLEAEIQRLEKRLERYGETQRWTDRRVELLMKHLKVYEHVEPAQPEKREIRKGKKPAPKYDPMNTYRQLSAQQDASRAYIGGLPGGWFK